MTTPEQTRSTGASDAQRSCAPEFFEPETEAYLEIMRAHCRLQCEINKLFKHYDVTPQQYALLRVLFLGAPEGLPCQDLAQKLANPGPDLTRMLDRLARQRWVRRRRLEDDRRVVMVELTEKSQDLVERVEPRLAELHRKRFAALSARDLAELQRLLGKIL